MPLGTKIPHWAYLNVTAGNVFDPATAYGAAALPESTPPTPSTISPSASPSTNSPDQQTEQPRQTSSNTPVSPKSNTGAIVGGVVGGVVVLTIAAGVFFLLRRKRRDAANAKMKDAPFRASLLNPPVSTRNLRLYDPTDPSTYPQNRREGVLVHNGSFGASAYPHTTYPARGGYQGFAEL